MTPSNRTGSSLLPVEKPSWLVRFYVVGIVILAIVKSIVARS
jgi:hypothetical protein